MARFGVSGVFAWIRGSVGGLTFSSCRGIPYVKQKCKRYRDANTKYQKTVRQIFATLHEEWMNLNFQEWAIWGDYAKNKIKTGMTKEPWKGKGDGKNAFVALNHILMSCGFAPIRIPPSQYLHKPPFPETDLIDKSAYKEEIRFNVRLPHQYESRCVCQVWVKKMEGAAYYYITAISPITTLPNEVVIDKIRVKEKGRTVEKKTKQIKNARLLLQLRTVAENGNFSLPTHIYRIEIKNT